MDRTGLNPLEKFAADAANRDWLAFLGAETSFEALEPEPAVDLDELHGIAKRAFVSEIESSAGAPKVAAWALSLVDDEAFDLSLAKLALAVDVVPPAVREFVFERAGSEVGFEDLHGLSKRAFVEELHDLLGGDVDLVKEALSLVEDDAYDHAVAQMAVGIEKVALPFAGVGRAIAGLGRRVAGGAMSGLGKSISAWGGRARDGAAMNAKRLEREGQALQAGVEKVSPPTFNPYQAGVPTVEQPGALRKARGMFKEDRGLRIGQDLMEGKGPGLRRQALGNRLAGAGDALAARGAPGWRPPAKPAPVPVTTPTPAGPTPASPAAAGPTPASPAAAGPTATAAPKTEPDGRGQGPDDGEGLGLWGSFSSWFDRATPLQKALALGVPALGAEAALD